MRLVRVSLEYFHHWPNSAGLYDARQAGFFAEQDMRLEFGLMDPCMGDTAVSNRYVEDLRDA